MRLVVALAVISALFGCTTSTPRAGASCDRDKFGEVCHEGALWQCRPRTGEWVFESKCGGAGGCTVTPGNPGFAGTHTCDALAGEPCGEGYFGPECSPDGKARLECSGGVVVRTACPASCSAGACK